MCVRIQYELLTNIQFFKHITFPDLQTSGSKVKQPNKRSQTVTVIVAVTQNKTGNKRKTCRHSISIDLNGGASSRAVSLVQCRSD